MASSFEVSHSSIHTCENCGRNFLREDNFLRHVRNEVCRKNTDRSVVARCEVCDQNFSRRDNYERHQRRFHLDGNVDFVFECGICPEMCRTAGEMAAHRDLHRQTARLQAAEAALSRGEEDEGGDADFVSVRSAHEGSCELLRYHFPPHVNSINEAMAHVLPRIHAVIERLRLAHKLFKLQFILHVEFVQIDTNATINRQLIVPFRSEMFQIAPLDETEEQVREALFQIANSHDSFTSRGSGWTINEVCFIDIEFAKCLPLAGGCSLHEVIYRQKIGCQVATNSFTPSSDDHMDCFYLAVASHFTESHSEMSETELAREFAHEHLIMSADVPVHIKEISRFETLNRDKWDLAVNVIYKDEEKNTYPVYVSPHVEAQHKIVLFLTFLQSENEQTPQYHYARVKDINSLFAPRVKSEDGKVRKRESWFCFNCFNYQTRYDAHQNHVRWCHKKRGQHVIMPKPGESVSYNPSSRNSFKLAYLLFFDFETLQVPTTACACSDIKTRAADEGRGEPPKKKIKQGDCPHNTKIMAKHEAFSYSYVLVDRENNVVEDFVYVGDDAAEHFLNRLLDMEEKYLEPLKDGGVPMKPLNEQQRREVQEAEECYLCEGELEKDRVLDHDHLTGEFLGVAHNLCNLHRREQIRLVTFAHNFSGFDSHIIIQKLGEVGDRIKKMSAIPLNTQKFKTLNINRICMLDSAAFQPDTLDRLVNTLVKSNHSFPLMKSAWADKNERDLLLRKGVYPYGFATSIKKLTKQRSLPPRSAFYNDIGETQISEEDYQHAQTVWKCFQIRNMIDYTRLYVRTDTYLLAEVVIKLREAIQDEFGLEIAQYLSLPMLAKDIMLKKTDVEMELMHDQEMAHLVQSNIRGGLSYVNTRHYDVDEHENRAIAYVDANNLYGHAMCYPMPLRDFEWMSEEEINNFDWRTQISEEDGTGYMLEVSLRYPEKLHLQHNSFPLAPEHVEISERDLSPYSRGCLEDLKKSSNYRAKKLTATFRNRERYLVHGLNLKFYLEMGLELITIHRGIKFYQEAFIKPYIKTCMRKRAAAKTKSEGDLMKLLSNSLFGKMIESGGNRMDCKFNYTRENAEKHFSDPLFCGFIICSPNFSVTFHKKKTVRMRQSWAVGFSILELSKLTMQKLMYEKVKPRFQNEVSTLMTDTDSWILVAPARDPDELVKKLADVMDFSNYAEDHPLHSLERKNQVGFLKNEVSRDTITKFVGIRSKTYVFKTLGEKTESRAKGVKRCYKRKISFEDFEKCLTSVSEVRVRQNLIVSKKHQNLLVSAEKTAFSSFDDKRYLLCAIHSVPYGSVLIKKSLKERMCYFCKRADLLV